MRNGNVYFNAAWGVAGLALLTMILLVMAWSEMSGTFAWGIVFEVLFLGIWGCSSLLYWSGRLKNTQSLFALAWIVAGLALFALIFTLKMYSDLGGVPGTAVAGDAFRIIFLGVVSTLGLLYLSGKLAHGE